MEARMKEIARDTGVPHRARRVVVALGGTAAALLLAVGAAHGLAVAAGPNPPPASEFGLGPRRSAAGTYQATVRPDRPFRTRGMHGAVVELRTASGAPVEGALLRIDGGMPQHGHGLPTAPRVTAALGGGAYRAEGLRFNMRGWWELKLHVDAPAGRDSVVFNLRL
jgi:hypothetical protein